MGMPEGRDVGAIGAMKDPAHVELRTVGGLQELGSCARATLNQAELPADLPPILVSRVAFSIAS